MAGPMVRYGKREIPHAQLRAEAGRVAAALRDAGVRHGDRIALILRNEPTFLSLSAACGLIGAVPVPVNWHWHGDELRHVLSHSGARVVFAHSDFVATAEAVLGDGVPLIEVPVPEELRAHYGASPVTDRRPLLGDWIGSREPHAEALEAAPMSLIYTSGTTGLPKGVIREAMTPDRSRQVAAATLGAMGLRPDMHTLITAPLYHSAPNAQGLFALALGIELTLMPRFTAEEFLRLVDAQEITHAQMVPTMFVRLLELPPAVRERYALRSLQCVVHAAAPCPAHVKRRIIDWFGPVVREYYGATEIGVVIACDTEEWLAHEGTVGRPIGGSEVRVFGPAGDVLDAGRTGEIYVRPPDYWPVFTYLGQDDRRREIERDGFISIGDVGHVDQEGYVYLSDRARDMVISGGVNIYPAEIEACLMELDGVRDVAVFGIPDDSFGEALAAHVDAEPSVGLTETAVREHVRTRLAAYKMPQVVVFDSELPREESGKIFKRRLRDRYWQTAGRNI